MKIWRFIIVIIALGAFAFMFFYHEDINTDIPDIKTLHELNKDFGKPEDSATIMLKRVFRYMSIKVICITTSPTMTVWQSFKALIEKTVS